MASGRVGGTRSKKRGLVGDVIYQVVRNADGTYTQMSYGKPEDVTKTITPLLQAQRMCTCMVEALMRDIRPIACMSMQSAANKSKSLNAFSAFNLQLVARDCKQNWYGNNQYYYPRTYNIGTESEQLGGTYMLSSGTWQYNGFDAVMYTDHVESIWPYAWAIGKRFAGMRWDIKLGLETVGQFLQRHYMSSLDKCCFVCFHDWYDWDEDPDDPTWFTRHSYIIASINSSVPREQILTRDTLQQLFICESDWDIQKNISDDGKNFYIGIMVDQSNNNEEIYTYGGFTISYLEGRKKISSSQMVKVPNWSDRYFEDTYPANVFGTWMGTPSVKPYPSPWGEPIPPHPQPRLPEEYQEVEWIQALENRLLAIPNFMNAAYNRLVGKFSLNASGTSSFMGNYQKVGVLMFYTYLQSGQDRFRFFVYKTASLRDWVQMAYHELGAELAFEYRPGANGWTFICDEEELSVDNVEWDSAAPKQSFEFWRNNGYRVGLKVWETKVLDFDGNVIESDLVPCYRKADGYCGFYDLIAGIFYTSQNGDGQFDHGDEILY